MAKPNARWRKTALAVAVTAALQANAQENTDQRNTAGDNAEAVDEIVVLGQEFQQSLVDRIPIAPEELPFTLNVIDRDFLNARNFTRPIEALTTLPNITRAEDRQGTGTTFFISRGFEAPLLVDNRVQNGFRGSGARDDSFVERYEVLKGPASIASGPVGGGGIVNTVTKTPQADRSAAVKVRADQFGSFGGDFDVNVGEIDGSDTFLFRVSGAYRDFQFDADQVGRTTTAIRPVATLNIGSTTSIKASVDYTRHDVTPASGFPLLQNGGIPDGIDTDTFAGYANSDGEVEDTLVSVVVNHEFLDNLKLTVRGSDQRTDFDYENTSGLYNYAYDDAGLDTMYGFPNLAITDSEATFVDAQLAYTADFWGRDQHFVIGVANNDTSFNRYFNTYSYDGPYSLADIDQPRFGDGGSGSPQPFTLFDQSLDSVLAEAAVRPTDRLTIVGGIRYDRLDEDTVNFRRGNAFVSGYDDTDVTVRLGATLGAAEGTNYYASYAQAFVPQFGLRRNNAPVPAETSDSFEIGAKGTLFDGAMSFQAAVFHTLRNDVALQDPNNGIDEFFVVSAGEVRVQGLELSTSYKPTEGLNFNLNLGYADIEVTESGDDEIAEPVFPELTGSFYASYEIQTGALAGLSLGGGLRYVGEREGPNVDWGSYTIADLNVSYPINESFDLQFDVLNVTDELYIENTVFNPVNRLTGGAVLGPPLTAVLTLNWRM
ncbi:MAG: TonB-dependent siderophore receptor [Pseudomonadota bacterium]